MARRQGFFDDLVKAGFKLPWRVAVLLAAGSFVVLHVVAISTPPLATGTTLATLGSVIQHQFIHLFASFFQYLIPAGLLIGATASVLNRSRSGALIQAARTNPAKSLDSMRWRDFERLVGEGFRQRGYAVTGFGGSGPDGGVDLGLAKNGERFLVQCKHWRNRQVGVTVVRELNGVIAAQEAHGGFVVTGGEFTREAREFAKKTTIELIDGKALEELIGCAPTQDQASTTALKVTSASAPTCPECGTAMVLRTAKQGKFAGRSFWGCPQYPKCSGIVQIS